MKIAIYPFTYVFAPIANQMSGIDKIEKIVAVTINKFDISANYGLSEKIVIKQAVDFSYSDIEEIYIVDDAYSFDFSEIILPAINESVEKHIPVHIYRKLNNMEYNLIANIGKDSKCIYLHQNNHEFSAYERLLSTDTPVLAVANIYPTIDSFIVQLEMYKHICSLGYRVLWISDYRIADFWGGHGWPDSIVDSYCNNENIVCINSYVRKIEHDENPDLILLGIPGSVMPFIPRYTLDYGLKAYEVGMAIDIDDVIVCLPTLESKNANINLINTYISNRLASNLLAVHISPYAIDYDYMHESYKVIAIPVDNALCIADYNNYDSDIIVNLHDKSHLERLWQSAERKYS